MNIHTDPIKKFGEVLKTVLLDALLLRVDEEAVN
jgi:hypothetical protein